MFKTLRIVCSIIAALLLAACVFIFIYVGMWAGFVTLLAVGVFFLLTLLFKNLQEKQEERQNPAKQEGDFFNPVHKDKDGE
jgi:fatty acid desaturase